MENLPKEEISLYVEKASVVILGLLFILFPITFTNLTTDIYVLPKQALLIFAAIVLALLFGARTVLDNKLRIRRTPFDVSIIVFILAVLLSSIFSSAIFNSLQNFVPLLFAALIYFAITQNSKNEKSFNALLYSFLFGSAVSALISIASFFNINVFPYDFTKIKTFTTFGTDLDLSLYLFLSLPVAVYFLYPFAKIRNGKLNELVSKHLPKVISLSIASIIILIGFIISIYSLIKLQQPTILPIETGFQTALSAISQDSGRIFQGLLFGSGFGEYSIVFSKFKQATFNLSPFWNLSFYRSSSFVLELLATTGILGIISYLFIFYKALKQKPLFLPVITIFAASLILPFSFYHIALLFIVLGIYSAYKGLNDNENFFDVEVKLVAFKKGIFAFSQTETKENEGNKVLTYFSFAVILIVVGFLGYFSVKYLISNISFQNSLVAASQNNGSLTYKYQTDAIASFPQSDVYERIFSQTNLTLASTLANSVPQGSTPGAQTTQTIYTLVQQSINAARQATNLSPQDPVNWQNLATIYRNLVGFGQNADSFAILAAQQAEQLDPTNPQEYINLGGIYYQLQSWDNAATQFQQAINLKSDYANGYYNLGHVYLQKGDLKGALSQFQIVKQLVSNNKTNLDQINSEIKTLEDQISNQQNAGANQQAQPQPLNVNSTSGVLPTQNPKVKIPAPEVITITPTPTGVPSPTPTPTPAH